MQSRLFEVEGRCFTEAHTLYAPAAEIGLAGFPKYTVHRGAAAIQKHYARGKSRRAAA